MPLLGLAAWAGGLLGRYAGGPVLLAAGLALLAGWLLVRRGLSRRPVRTGAAVLLVAAAVAASALVRQEQVRASPVAALAADGAVVTLEGTVTSDARVVAGRFGDQVLVRLRVRRITGRGTTYALGAPVVVLGHEGWRDLPLGAQVRTTGRLAPSDGPDTAALLLAAGRPSVVAAPDVWWRGAAAVRASLRASVAGRPPDQRALVPALVDGDDQGVATDLAADFRATGLTHLMAVSGTNLTLLVGFVLVVARWLHVRGRWLQVVAALGIAGFVLLARTEPSVLRAAVMGSIGLVAMGVDGRERGTRALGVALVVLLLVDPALAVAPGFALSVLATAGILLLAPGWRDALACWLPRWIAEAVAVPAAAQLACTPLVAAISGQVSLVAVAANLAAAPPVGPATVLGLAGGLLGLAWAPLGRVAGTLASWCVAWIVLVAHHGAGLPSATVDWGTGAVALAVLSVGSLVLAGVAPVLLRRRSTGVACGVVLVLAVAGRLPAPWAAGWPPAGWVLVACDVGQGDALVLNAAPGAAVVVDAGPDPAPVDRCLDRLGVTRVPLLLLTHFHADHVDGISGVLDGHPVGAVETTRLQDPPQGVREVTDAAAGAGLTPLAAPYGVTRRIGDVTLQVLWPLPDSPVAGPGDGSTANEASVVLLVAVRGMRLLLAGDVEPEGQARLAAMLPGLQVDVLKVPHHGSRYQDLPFLLSLGARLDLVSVGADNDYGHPAASTIAALAGTGARVLRTDLDGDLAVVVHRGVLGWQTRR
nr:ComEC/Rec2 family competence protein [Nocardioides panaciterrulae]